MRRPPTDRSRRRRSSRAPTDSAGDGPVTGFDASLLALAESVAGLTRRVDELAAKIGQRARPEVGHDPELDQEEAAQRSERGFSFEELAVLRSKNARAERVAELLHRKMDSDSFYESGIP